MCCKKYKFKNNYDYDKELNNLPIDLEYIELSKNYDKKISNIPGRLKTIKCDSNYKFIDDFIGYNVMTY